MVRVTFDRLAGDQWPSEFESFILTKRGQRRVSNLVEPYFVSPGWLGEIYYRYRAGYFRAEASRRRSCTGSISN